MRRLGPDMGKTLGGSNYVTLADIEGGTQAEGV